MDSESKEVCVLNIGEKVEVVRQSGIRVRIINPVEGWCSIESKSGATILKPLV